MTENFNIEDDPFIKLSKKVLLVLENLINEDHIEIPVSLDTMLEIAIGAITEAQVSGEIELIDVFNEHREFAFDALIFEEGGEYTLHDILAQVVCFRLIDMMKEYLGHIRVSYFDELESVSE